MTVGKLADILNARIAALTDCAAAVLCEGVQPDAALAERAAEKGVNLLLTDLPVYEAAVLVSGYIKR